MVVPVKKKDKWGGGDFKWKLWTTISWTTLLYPHNSHFKERHSRPWDTSMHLAFRPLLLNPPQVSALVGFSAPFSAMKPQLLAKPAIHTQMLWFYHLSVSSRQLSGCTGRGISGRVLCDRVGFHSPGEMICRLPWGVKWFFHLESKNVLSPGYDENCCII